MNPIPTEISGPAARQLTGKAIARAVCLTADRAEAAAGWRAGRSLALTFTTTGTAFRVALDFGEDGYRARVSLLHARAPSPRRRNWRLSNA